MMACKEKLIELSIAAYRVEKSSYLFSRGVETSVFFSSTNNIIMISTLKILIKREKNSGSHSHWCKNIGVLFDFILFYSHPT